MSLKEALSARLQVSRSANYRKQVFITAPAKLAAIGFSFLFVPVSLRYLGAEQFGVWSTLLMVISWILFFDLGIGNGMRNKVAESIAKGDTAAAALFVSSGFTALGLLILAAAVLLMGASFLIPWRAVFNISSVPESDLRLAVQIAGGFILVNFWLNLTASVLNALQQSSVPAVAQMASNGLALLFVFGVSHVGLSPTLPWMAAAYGLALVVTNTAVSAWFFSRNPALRPLWHLSVTHLRPLLGTGAKFFLIQMAVLVIFATDKIVIAQIFGPTAVTQYEVVFKLFSAVTIAHTLISAPLWSAYTEAYHKGDLQWIRKTLRRQRLLLWGVVLGTVVLALNANLILSLWVGPNLKAQPLLLGIMAAFVSLAAWNNVHAMVVNGLGETSVQLRTALLGMIINVPLAIFFASYVGLGPAGVLLAAMVSLAPSGVAVPFQVKMLLASRQPK